MSKITEAVIPFKMPWLELIDAFVDTLPERMRRKDQLKMKDPLQELYEFRTLVIGGHRQSGKTEAGRQLILKNKKARLWNANNCSPNSEQDKTILKRTISGLDTDILKNLEILVINQDGFKRNNPMDEVKYIFENEPHLFHPNFSVIHIL